MGSEQDKKKYEAYVSDDILKDVERFLLREARLLDTENLREWYEDMLSQILVTSLRQLNFEVGKNEDINMKIRCICIVMIINSLVFG